MIVMEVERMLQNEWEYDPKEAYPRPNEPIEPFRIHALTLVPDSRLL